MVEILVFQSLYHVTVLGRIKALPKASRTSDIADLDEICFLVMLCVVGTNTTGRSNITRAILLCGSQSLSFMGVFLSGGA